MIGDRDKNKTEVGERWKALGSLSDYTRITGHACLTPHIYPRGREQNSLIQRLWNEGFFLFPDGVSIS